MIGNCHQKQHQTIPEQEITENIIIPWSMQTAILFIAAYSLSRKIQVWVSSLQTTLTACKRLRASAALWV